MARTRITTEDFKTKAKLIHGDRYDYSDTVYFKSRFKSGDYLQKTRSFSPNRSSHLRGHGCSQCSQPHVENYMAYLKKLNEKHGWRLQGGNEEFCIPSKLTPAGKYRFDGVDKETSSFLNSTSADITSSPSAKEIN